MKHTNDFTHLLVYHLIPMALAAAVIFGAVYLIVRLSTRRGGTRKHRPGKVGGLNRQQRRQQRAMNSRKRRY